MLRSEQTIVSCALPGSVLTPTMSPHLPVTPQSRSLIDQGLEVVEAGAAMLQLHARDPEAGRPSASAVVFGQFVPELRAFGAVNIITPAGSTRMIWDP
jgi:uncharacterized protein (DUF849 family)